MIRTDQNRAVTRSRSAIRGRPSAFTLAELLVVVAIIGIVSALVLGAAGRAAETGRAARTTQMIARLHTLVMEHYDTFGERRVELNGAAELAIAQSAAGFAGSGSGTPPGVTRAQFRLRAAREQMKMEMPDRWSDFLLVDLAGGLPSPAALPEPVYLAAVPQLAEVYRAQYAKIATLENTITGQPNTAADLLSNEGAECLYLVVMFATGDGESRGRFSEGDFGDTDGDGAPELLDAWGNPIRFLRWAPGFRSELQLSHEDLSRLAAGSANPQQAVTRAVQADRDPLDLFRVDRPFDPSNPFATEPDQPLRGWRLVPLIYSAGPDETPGVTRLRAVSAGSNDPYLTVEDPNDSSRVTLRGVSTAGATDNITNHLISGE